MSRAEYRRTLKCNEAWDRAYAVLVAEIATGRTRAERIEKGRRALIEAVAVRACLDAQWPSLTEQMNAWRWLRDAEVGGGKWWIEKVLQLDFAALVERMGGKP